MSKKAKENVSNFFWKIVVDTTHDHNKIIKYSKNLTILLSEFNSRISKSLNPYESQLEYGKDLKELIESELNVIYQSANKNGIWLIDKIIE